MAIWTQRMAANHDGSMYGYIEIGGLELVPFGSPYP